MCSAVNYRTIVLECQGVIGTFVPEIPPFSYRLTFLSRKNLCYNKFLDYFFSNLRGIPRKGLCLFGG